MSTVTWIDSVEAAEPAGNALFGQIVDSYHVAGFDAGYRRAANDLLADFILLATKLRSDVRSGDAVLSADRLDDLRQFERQLEQAADGASRDPLHVYVDGGLGI